MYIYMCIYIYIYVYTVTNKEGANKLKTSSLLNPCCGMAEMHWKDAEARKNNWDGHQALAWFKIGMAGLLLIIRNLI